MSYVPFNEAGFVGGIGAGWGSDAPATLTLVTTDNASVSESNCGRVVNATNALGMFTNVLTLTTSAQYTYSVYIKNNGGATNCGMVVRDSVTFSSVADNGPFTITSSWARYTVTFNASATNATHLFYVKGDSGTGFDFYVDAFMVNDGPTAYAYIGLPDDPAAPVLMLPMGMLGTGRI